MLREFRAQWRSCYRQSLFLRRKREETVEINISQFSDERIRRRRNRCFGDFYRLNGLHFLHWFNNINRWKHFGFRDEVEVQGGFRFCGFCNWQEWWRLLGDWLFWHLWRFWRHRHQSFDHRRRCGSSISLTRQVQGNIAPFKPHGLRTLAKCCR